MVLYSSKHLEAGHCRGGNGYVKINLYFQKVDKSINAYTQNSRAFLDIVEKAGIAPRLYEATKKLANETNNKAVSN